MGNLSALAFRIVVVLVAGSIGTQLADDALTKDHAQKPSLKSIDSFSMFPCLQKMKDHPARDNEHRTTSGTTTNTSRAGIASRDTS